MLQERKKNAGACTGIDVSVCFIRIDPGGTIHNSQWFNLFY